MTHTTDITVIGAGPAGLFTVFQAGMLKMRCHVVDVLDMIGGQCSALYPEKPIYDIPAYPSITAENLVENLRQQADPFQPTYHLNQTVDKVTPQDDGSFIVQTSKGTMIHSKAVIIAAGSGAFGPNRPPMDNIEDYENKSVHYMVKRRKEFVDKTVVIAGGGDSAVDWAISLAYIAKKLYVVHRRPKFRCAPTSYDHMKRLADEGQIELVIPYQLHSLEGENGQISKVNVATLKGDIRALEADYLLPFFGLSMNLGPIANWGLNLHQKHVAVDPATMESNIEGIYAIGDICSYPNKLKLILNGFAEAAMACHHAYHRVFPDTALHFEYSTSKAENILNT